jgi:mono/diheme cytochrome c family protein
MVDQPSFRAQRDPLPLPQGSIPVPERQAPLADGKRLFEIYCSLCHGVSGRGDGPVGAKMVKPADLTAAKYRVMKDDFFYNVIGSGSGLMPPYAESLSSSERRQVINYVRRLQRP